MKFTQTLLLATVATLSVVNVSKHSFLTFYLTVATHRLLPLLSSAQLTTSKRFSKDTLSANKLINPHSQIVTIRTHWLAVISRLSSQIYPTSNSTMNTSRASSVRAPTSSSNNPTSCMLAKTWTRSSNWTPEWTASPASSKWCSTLVIPTSRRRKSTPQPKHSDQPRQIPAPTSERTSPSSWATSFKSRLSLKSSVRTFPPSHPEPVPLKQAQLPPNQPPQNER